MISVKNDHFRQFLDLSYTVLITPIDSNSKFSVKNDQFSAKDADADEKNYKKVLFWPKMVMSDHQLI